MSTAQEIKRYLQLTRTLQPRSYGQGSIIVRDGSQSLYGRIWVAGQPEDCTLKTDPSHYVLAQHAVEAAYAELRKLKQSAIELQFFSSLERSSSVTVNQILDAYFLELERRLRTGQKISRQSIIDARGFVDRHIRPHIGIEPAEEVTKNRIEQLRDIIARTPKLRGGGQRSLSSIQAPLRQLRAAYRYALYDCDPRLITKMPKIKIADETHLARQGYFPEELIPALLPFFDPSTRVAIAVALDTGLRSIKELLQRRWEDLNWSASTIYVPGSDTKNDEGRSVPIRPSTMDLLVDSKQIRDEQFPKCPWIFYWRITQGRGLAGRRMATIYSQFKDAMALAAESLGRPDLLARVPHDCRRSFVTNLSLDRVLTDTEIQSLSGHKDPSVFERYNVPSRQAAAIAVQAYRRKAVVTPIRRSGTGEAG